MAAILTNGLTKRYGSLEALSGLSISVEEGESFCLLGPNGSGKTTTIGILTGSLSATAGKAVVMGVDVAADPIGVKRKIGIVPEMEYPPSFLTVREYLDLVCSLRKVDDPRPKIDRWIQFFGLEDKENVLCKDLSKGTKKKVMLSAAFVHDPKLLFLDEPFLDLDPIVQRNTREYLRSYVKEGGTIFLSTHILEIAEKLCDRVGILYNGRLIASGKLAELKRSKESLEDVFMRLVVEAA
ncbi:ABC-type multidrug transport system, ATPase component [Methanocella conradii HZ254]|uniref:ABC-type multidrug transport system, ATPase component n=1 Tax=Methanocella conradii (strain DSM 24694 / JCM 17849 / CGMCC 1.5162 / HZ254) TaxID=1041930 RepID=H8I811_METCZ|nr:ABC transporter ATP-binding protein [Methanocella conradii]AFD00411.1 ABC-type multidrug transport system, ATPase component [Methanocella conradii HZ254]